MKSLEILKYAQSCPFARMMIPFKDNDFIIAIKEIEALENRSCESCKRKKHCYIWDYAGIPIDSLKDFWCNGWESKC